MDDLVRLGQKTRALKHEFKRRCGFDLEGVRIPRRILETPTRAGVLDEGFLRQALQVYPAVRLARHCGCLRNSVQSCRLSSVASSLSIQTVPALSLNAFGLRRPQNRKSPFDSQTGL